MKIKIAERQRLNNARAHIFGVSTLFVDELAFYLFMLGFAGLLLAYVILNIYSLYRRKKGNLNFELKSVSVPLAGLGIYMTIVGLIGQLTWFLPGPYNILFLDPLVAFGLLLIIFAVSVRFRLKLQYAGILALLTGFMTVYYGFSGYQLNLTAAPLEMFAMFSLFGLAGVLAYPVSVMVDRFNEHEKNTWLGWHLILLVFLILIVFASLAALYAGAVALPAHLASPP